MPLHHFTPVSVAWYGRLQCDGRLGDLDVPGTRGSRCRPTRHSLAPHARFLAGVVCYKRLCFTYRSSNGHMRYTVYAQPTTPEGASQIQYDPDS
jgi:hypothetical protein